MKFCNECGEAEGYCICRSCECGETAQELCFECEAPFCGDCLQKRPGFEHLRWCAACVAKLAEYAPCQNADPARACAGNTFAPELLHECIDCNKAFCPACIVKTPLPGFYALYHCPSCDAIRKQRSAA